MWFVVQFRSKLACLIALTGLTIPVASRAQDQVGDPCRPEQLRLTTDIAVVGSNLHISVRMTNTSNRTCVLAGAPRVASVSSDGEAVLQVRWPVAEGNAEGGNLDKGQELISLSPGTQGLFVIHTVNKTAVQRSSTCTGSLRVYLPDGAPGNPDSHAIATVTAESCGEISISGYRFS